MRNARSSTSVGNWIALAAVFTSNHYASADGEVFCIGMLDDCKNCQQLHKYEQIALKQQRRKDLPDGEGATTRSPANKDDAKRTKFGGGFEETL